jgi:hypothetical protein
VKLSLTINAKVECPILRHRATSAIEKYRLPYVSPFARMPQKMLAMKLQIFAKNAAKRYFSSFFLAQAS